VSEDDEEKSLYYRRRNSDSTDSITNAIAVLKSKDFTKSMGSGILVSLTTYEGKPLCAEFTLPAEDMENIKPNIIESLKKMLKLRRALLTSEISQIDKVTQ
jgi:hypothetical protein